MPYQELSNVKNEADIITQVGTAHCGEELEVNENNSESSLLDSLVSMFIGFFINPPE